MKTDAFKTISFYLPAIGHKNMIFFVFITNYFEKKVFKNLYKQIKTLAVKGSLSVCQFKDLKMFVHMEEKIEKFQISFKCEKFTTWLKTSFPPQKTIFFKKFVYH